MSYQNLKAEMKRIGVTQGDIAEFLSMSTNNVSLKINGKVPFTVDEAWKIRERFFPDATLDYLMGKTSDRDGEAVTK